MPKVTPIETINVDDQEIAVAGLPEGIKALVAVYEEWTQRELDVADELQMVRAAKETLGRQIVQTYRQFAAEAAQAAAAQAPEPAPAPAPAPAPEPAEDLKANDLADAPDGTVAVTGDDAAE